MIQRIICGDCLDIMKTIEDKSIDMILCDLPYGTTACKWDTVIPFEPLWTQYKRIIKDNAAVVLTASQPFTSMLIMSNPKMFKYCWVWDKKNGGNPFLVKKRPIMDYEDIVVFNAERYFPQISQENNYNIMAKGKKKPERSEHFSDYAWDNQRNVGYPRAIIRGFVMRQRDKVHPTQKPVALFEYLIKTYTNEGDLVLDSCAGSGTTGVACKNLNRNFILIEKDLTYYDIICKRIDATPERLI